MDNMQGGQPLEPTREMGELELLWAVITRPQAAFEQIARKPRYVVPAVMIGLGYLIYALGANSLMSGVVASAIQESMRTAPHGQAPPFDPAMLARIASSATVCCFPFQAASSWFLWTIIVYLAATAFRGQGRYTTLLSALGYAWVPYLFAYVIGGIYLFTYARSMGPMASALAPQQMQAVLMPAFRVYMILIILASIWYLFLGSRALEKTMAIPYQTSLLIIGALKLVSICISAASLALNSLGMPGVPTPRVPPRP